jgi:hypothetical protein
MVYTHLLFIDDYFCHRTSQQRSCEKRYTMMMLMMRTGKGLFDADRNSSCLENRRSEVCEMKKKSFIHKRLHRQ